MKKMMMLLLGALLVSSAMAEIKSVQGYNSTTFYQFVHNEPTNTGDYTGGRHFDQNWLAAQTIRLYVGQEMDVWLSNYINSWYAPIDALNGNVYQMGQGQYGAWQLNGNKTWVGSGATTTVTYTDGAGHDNSTDGYFLGHFEGGEEIALWMTALENEGGEQVDTMQYVYDAAHNTTLASRLDATHDLAGNVRINFGLTTIPSGEGREFVAFGVHDESAVPSGQPLPGVLTSALLGFGVVLGVTRKRKR